MFTKGQTILTDMTPGADTLLLDYTLWGGGLTVGDVVFLYADVTSAGLFFDFDDGSTLMLLGLTDTDTLIDSIALL